MIYFAQSPDGGPIKIGCSDQLEVRLKQLEYHYRQPLELLATMPGGRDEERAIHERFSHLRFGRTEQFRPALDLMEFIGLPLLVGANPDAVEPMFNHGYSRKGVITRVSEDALAEAKIAASIKRVSLTEFLSEVVMDASKKVIEDEMKRRAKPKKSD